MAYNRNNLKKIRDEYATKHLIAENAARERQLAIHAALPEVAQIDAKLSKTGLALMAASLATGDAREKRFTELREENLALNARRDQLLVEAGYPADYTDVKYECPACSDSGYVGIRMCDCMKKALALAGFESSGIGALIRKQNFDNFSLDYYKKDPEALAVMAKILEKTRHYAETFDPATSGNLLLLGGTGLGKTHLSSAIARCVIERGFDVYYTTMLNMISDFEAEQFGNNRNNRGERTDKYFDCDLLIIDDLGTELANQFTVSCLYNIINVRINQGRPILISTNLTQKELLQTYSERITSRIFGEFVPYRFLGTDVRRQKLTQL